MRTWLLTAIAFAAIAPTLVWLEFSNSPEALNVATALEIRRSGNWLVPTLQGQTRLAKPPLPAWVTAALISESTLTSISSTDRAERDRGFIWLAWQVRWPALLAGCAMLLCTAQLGRMIGGPQCGVLSLIVAATSFMFLRFTRYNTADIHLALWVAAANVMLVHGLLNCKRWTAFLGAGVALGLALMSKGPVSLVQSVLPVALWMIVACLMRLTPRQSEAQRSAAADLFPDPDLNAGSGPSRVRSGPGMGFVLIGLCAMLAVALPWVILVLQREPDAVSLWLREITREGAKESGSGKWYSYLVLVPYMGPWFVFFLVGMFIAAVRRRSTDVLALLLLFVPVLVMSCFKDRVDRYLLPVLPAAAVLSALGIQPLLVWRRRLGLWLVGSLFVVMLIAQAGFILVYRDLREGRAELKPLADTILDHYPDAEVYNAHPDGKRPPPELGVYLNRVLMWIDDPSRLQPGSVPKVLLMLQRRNEAEPIPPAGFESIEKRPRDREHWWVFVLPPQP